MLRTYNALLWNKLFYKGLFQTMAVTVRRICLGECNAFSLLSLQALGTLVPPRAATHIIVALEVWKEERRKRRAESRAAREAETQQRLTSRLVTDISEGKP